MPPMKMKVSTGVPRGKNQKDFHFICQVQFRLNCFRNLDDELDFRRSDLEDGCWSGTG